MVDIILVFILLNLVELLAQSIQHALFFVVHKPRAPLLPGKVEATGLMMSKTSSLRRGFIQFTLVLA